MYENTVSFSEYKYEYSLIATEDWIMEHAYRRQTICRTKGTRDPVAVFLNLRAAARYRALASIIMEPREAWRNYNMLQDFISPVDN